MSKSLQSLNMSDVSYLFNEDFNSVKIFKDLLYVVSRNELENPSIEISENIIYNYMLVRVIVKRFIDETVYENLYTSDLYDNLIEMLIDYFSCLMTVIYMRKSITDVDIQPELIIDEYLRSFGFPCIDLFDAIQKREICRGVYSYLRKKGSPELIKKILIQMGFTNFCILEFWLNKFDAETSEGEKIELYKFKPEIISMQGDKRDQWELYLKNKSYTLDETTQEDPLWALTAEELDDQIAKEGIMTLPAKSPYYQVSVCVSDTESDRLAAIMIYACTKKDLYNLSIGQDMKTIYYPLFGKVNMLDLMYAYAMVIDVCGDAFDVFALNCKDLYYYFDKTRPHNVETRWGKMDLKLMFDLIAEENIVKPLFDSSYQINDNTDINLFQYDKKDNYYDNMKTKENLLHDRNLISRTAITRYCYGWNGDVSTTDINQILRDINNKYSEVIHKIEYYPSRFIYDTISKIVKLDNCRTRLEDMDLDIRENFISPCLFGDMDDTLNEFYSYNASFYDFMYANLNNYKDGSIEKYDYCIGLLICILTLMENYIYSKCQIKFNLKQMLISYVTFCETTYKMDKGFAPYKAKLIDPDYIFMFEDIPYDQILIADKEFGLQASNNHREVFWRAKYQSLFDLRPPEPYDPVFDWEQHMDLPVDQYGYYDKTRTIIINGKEYAPKFDFDNDKLLISSGIFTLYSGYKRRFKKKEIVQELNRSFDVTKSMGKVYTFDNLVNITNVEARKVIAKLDMDFKLEVKYHIEDNIVSYKHKLDNDWKRIMYKPTIDEETGEVTGLSDTEYFERLVDVDEFDDIRWDDKIEVFTVTRPSKKSKTKKTTKSSKKS